jgi:hypothetical protein
MHFSHPNCSFYNYIYLNTLPQFITAYALYIYASNFMVEWSTLLLRIQEVPGSNLDPETGYPDRGYS